MLPTSIREVERHPRMNTVNANSRADVVGSCCSSQNLHIESEELLLCFLVRDSHKTYFDFALIRQPAISFLYSILAPRLRLPQASCRAMFLSSKVLAIVM